MPTVVVFGMIALAVLAAAAVLSVIFSPRLAAGTASPGQASAVTLIALLITPTIAALLALTLARHEAPVIHGATLYFYAGYAVGLACFIALNRRYRRISRRH